MRILFFGEVFERFSYWGLQSILILYLVSQFHLQHKQAYMIFGSFTAFTFVVSVIGGVLADKWIGFRKAILIGILLDILGNVLLALPDQSLIYFGLAAITIGTSLFVPSNANLFGKCYGDVEHHKRDSAFTLFYMGNNVGGFLAPIVFGMIAMSYGWHNCFILSVVLLSIWFFVFLFQGKNFKMMEAVPKKIPGSAFLYLLFPIGILFIWFLIQHVAFSGFVLGLFGVIVFLGLIIYAFKRSKAERNSILVLIWMMLFGLLFFAFEFQVNSSLLIFANQYVNRRFFSWIIPTPSLASIEPFFIIVLTPLIAYFWGTKRLKKSEYLFSSKIGIAFLLAGVGFIIFALSAYEASSVGDVGLVWFLIGNAFLGAGEIYLMPFIIASITRLAPEYLKGTLMGTLYLALAFSGYLAGLIASLTVPKTTAHLVAMDYAHVYLVIAALSCGIAIIWQFSCYFLQQQSS